MGLQLHLGLFWPIFGTFCYILRNKTCFIPLGIILFLCPWEYFFFFNSLGNKTLFLPNIYSKWLDFFCLFFGNNFPPNFWPKKSFFCSSAQPQLVFWPEKSFYSLKLVNFWTLLSIFFGPKNLFFLHKLSPSLFFFVPKSHHWTIVWLLLLIFCNNTFFIPLGIIFF